MANTLLRIAEEECIQIIECTVPCDIKGLYLDGTIALRPDLTHAEKACILAEELGHHYTTSGNILDQSNLKNEKQELRARAWAAEMLLPIENIVSAFEHGCRNRFEMADFLDVTEAFITESVEYYKRKHGLYFITDDDYVIYFDPLGVMKKL